MNLKAKIIKKRELKQMTYIIINKLHDLERASKVNIFYERKINNNDNLLAASACIIGIKELFLCSLVSSDESLKKLKVILCKRLISLNNNLLNNKIQKKQIIKGRISKILEIHSEIFEYIHKKSIEIEFDCTTHWINTYLPFLVLYDINKGKPKLIKKL